MKKLKRRRLILPIVSTIALLLCLTVPCAAAGADTAAVTISFDRSCYASGDTATVQTRISAVSSSFQLGGIQFQLSQPSGLQLQSLTMDPTGVCSGTGICQSSAESRRGAYSQAGTNSLLIDSDGIVIAEASYKVNTTGSAMVELGLNELMLFTAEGNEVSAHTVSGSTEITRQLLPDDPVYTLLVDGSPDTKCMAGDTVTVTLQLTGETDRFSVYGMQDNITFDPDCFELVADSVSAAFGNATGKTADGAYNRVYFNLWGSNPTVIPPGEVIVSFQLRVKASGTIEHSKDALSDQSGSPLPHGLQPCSVSVYDENDGSLVWLPDAVQPTLRNISVQNSPFTVWYAAYEANGKLFAFSRLADGTLSPGECLAFSPEAVIPTGGNAKLIVTDAHFMPLTSCFSIPAVSPG